MYSLDEIELSPNTGAVESELHRKADNSDSVAKMLNNVEKSKDHSKNIV